MATPGYPQMGQMPPMGGPPMGGPPMGGPGRPGGPPMQPPMRRGTSKAVPVVVSAGLAVGVFCGLLFGVGKKSEAVASASAKAEVKPEPKAGSGAAPATTPKPTTPKPANGSAAGSATVAGAGSAAAAGSAAPTVAKPKTIKLTLTIKPDGAAEDAKLWIDDKEVEGMTIELPADKKSVKVEVKSRGYRSIDKKIQLAGGDTAIELEMAKRSSGGGTGGRPPKRPDRPPSNEDNGLIDI